MEMKDEEMRIIETEKKKEKRTMSESLVEIETAMVALGVVLLIAGAKHALASLVEQWRATVFLFLNILLLAILFTSVQNPSNSNNKSSSEIKIKSSHHIINTNKRKQKINKTIKSSIKKAAPAPSLSKCMSTSSASVQNQDYLCPPMNEETTTTTTSCRNVDEKEGKREDDVVVVVDDDKEDLNARVKAFIVMFRQQLALDIAKGRRSASSVSEFASSTTTTQGSRRASFSL